MMLDRRTRNRAIPSFPGVINWHQSIETFNFLSIFFLRYYIDKIPINAIRPCSALSLNEHSSNSMFFLDLMQTENGKEQPCPVACPAAACPLFLDALAFLTIFD